VLKPPVDADAEIEMDHAVAGLQFRKGGEDLLFARFGKAAPLDARTKYLLFGDDRQSFFLKAEAARYFPGEDIHPPVTASPFGREAPLGNGKREFIVAEKFMEALCLAFLVACQDHPALFNKPCGELIDQGAQHPFAVGRDGQFQIAVVPGGEAERPFRTFLPAKLKIGDVDPPAAGALLADLFHGEEQIGALAEDEIIFSSPIFGGNQFSRKLIAGGCYPLRIDRNRD
jgi:hypothetical protein